jgi:hypothetical protein
MNNIFRNISCFAVLLFVAGTAVSAKEWRGIVPLKSTRQDVERQFGIQKQSSEGLAYYNLPNEIAVFHFKVGTCDSDSCGWTWNVPAGTVVAIGVIPKGIHRKEEYPLGSDATVHDNGGGLTYYSDNSAGLTVETYKNVVTLVDHHPEASQDNLHCPKIEDCCGLLRTRFDEYENPPFRDEKARLDNFVIVMNGMFGRGVIEILGPSKRFRQSRIKLAARAKRYLIKERGLEPERLILVDGGFNKTPLTRLNIYAIGGLASQIYIITQSDPES